MRMTCDRRSAGARRDVTGAPSDTASRRRFYRGMGIEPRIDAPRIVLKDLLAVGVADRRLVDIALGVVEAEAGPRIVALHRADHFRSKQYVVDRHNFGEQIDARLMIDAGIEVDVVAHDLGKLRLAVV